MTSTAASPTSCTAEQPGPGGHRPAPLGVVLVHRNRPDVVVDTVAAFEAQGLPLEVVVVDNSDSTTVAGELGERLAGRATVLSTGRNAGFGPGANTGLRHWLASGTGDRVVVAPHDARPEPGCLAAITAELDLRPDAGLASAEFGPGFDLVPTFDWVIGGFYKKGPRGRGWQDVDYPHGTLMVATRRLLEEVGLFDDRYFAYCEEADLGRRARASGWRVGMVWGAVVRNDTLPPQLVSDYLKERNTLLLVRDGGRWPTFVRGVLGAGMAVGRARRDRAAAGLHLRLWWHAVRDFRRRSFGPPPPEVWDLVAGRDRPEVPADEWAKGPATP
ncbi:MAG TPA: glycosyltransferase [Acidimicrobiales bacterium]|nr:glycosyltransferase [Acidimicrobiales bacterium]